jgi:hypothetical protein
MTKQITVFCILLFATTPALAEGAGMGAHPVSDEVASLWVVQGGPDDPPRVVFAFFVGDSGWHDRKWETRSKGNLKKQAETFFELISDQLTLSVRLAETGTSAFVQGFEFAFAESNVFLVPDIGREVRPEDIVPLGHYQLNPMGSGILSIKFLIEHPDAARRIGVDPASIAPPEVPDLVEIASGTWGVEVDGATCDDNPHTIEFAADRKTMTLRYAVGVGDQPRTISTYSVIGESANYLRMKMNGETRLTPDGESVVWDLVLLSADSYCWHRTDWQEGGCTQPATRCP